jgi:hypothetical protein
MDHVEVQQLLSQAHDGEEVDTRALTEARAHAESCAECTAFVRGMEAIAAVPAPTAPDGLATRVVDHVGTEAASAAAEAAAPPREERRSWLRPAIVIGVSFAALAVVGVVSIAVLTGQDENGEDAVDTDTLATAPDAGARAAEESVEGEAAADETEAVAGDWVSFEGFVYEVAGTQSVDSSDVETVGVLATAMDSERDPPTEYTVHAPIEQDVRGLYLSTETSGTYYRLDPVGRFYEGETYHLETGTPLDRFGEWPTLPDRFAPPAAADGAPTFAEWGDSGGVTVYVAVGRDPDYGIAVAPGSSPTDPARGNPDWSWWDPVD